MSQPILTSEHLRAIGVSRQAIVIFNRFFPSGMQCDAESLRRAMRNPDKTPEPWHFIAPLQQLMDRCKYYHNTLLFERYRRASKQYSSDVADAQRRYNQALLEAHANAIGAAIGRIKMPPSLLNEEETNGHE